MHSPVYFRACTWRLASVARLALAGFILLALSTLAVADSRNILAAQSEADLDHSYARVLPLEGGSNFRDLGGYRTTDGKTVKRGLLFRSGVMANLTTRDQDYLNRFAFKTVVDLRSREELELFPNAWAQHAQLNYVYDDYSITQMLPAATDKAAPLSSPGDTYRAMPDRIKPQLQQYFQEAIDGDVPMVVNCAAGQDRTGIASALMLSALGVPRETIYRDYLLSTQYRLPQIEIGQVDLPKAAQHNAFAAMMLRYQNQASEQPQPLLTENNVPFLKFTFDDIEKRFGSVERYLDVELGVDDRDLNILRQRFLQ